VHKKAFESNPSGNQVYREQDGRKALSCLKWSLDGRKISVGDSEGFVSIWNLDKELYNPKQSDFDQMEKLCLNNSTEEG